MAPMRYSIAKICAMLCAVFIIELTMLPLAWGILAVVAASMYAVVLRWQYGTEAAD